MKNWKCKIGVHNYKTIGQQNVPNMVGGYSMVTLNREVQKCERCGKIHFVGYDKKLKDEYSESQYKKIIDLEKLIDGTEDDRKKFVKSIMRLLGMTKWDLPNELYRYL